MGYMEELKALLGPFVGMRIKTSPRALQGDISELRLATITGFGIVGPRNLIIFTYDKGRITGGYRRISDLNKTWWYA